MTSTKIEPVDLDAGLNPVQDTAFDTACHTTKDAAYNIAPDAACSTVQDTAHDIAQDALLNTSLNTPRVEDILNAEGIFVSSSAGTSMYPMLRNRRDTIIVYPAKHPLKPYDVALYRSGERYVLHRVLAVYPDHYEIRGDNCVTTELVPREYVFGVLGEFYRGERLISTKSCAYKAYAKAVVSLSPVIRSYHRMRTCASKFVKACLAQNKRKLR